MRPEIFELFADNATLPKGTCIENSFGIVELSDNELRSANRCPNSQSDYVPFWILGWSDLHSKLLIPNRGNTMLNLTIQQLKRLYTICSNELSTWEKFKKDFPRNAENIDHEIEFTQCLLDVIDDELTAALK